MDLKELRNEIDLLDDRIAELFIERMDVVTRVAEYKRNNNVGITHADRENAILDRVTEGGTRPYSPQLRALFTDMMAISRGYQSSLNEKD